MKRNIPFPLLGFQPLEFATFLAILLLGLLLRFTDLTDPPLDYHPMRQYRGALLARAMYYQMLPDADPVKVQLAIETTATIEPQEPPILERLTAITYLITGEQLWVARAYSILFWAIAGLAFFALARRMTSTSGALIALAYFMLLPFAVVTSRTFQPDPFMVMWIALTLLVAYRWGEIRSWKWAVATGALAGWAMLVKITAVYYLAPALVVIVLTNWGLRQALREKWVWAAALLAGIIPAVYYVGAIGGEAGGWFAGWGLSFTGLLTQPRFYISWLKFLDFLFDLTLVGLALIGVALTPRTKDRLLLLSLWGGYLLFGLSFPYPIRTHEYYSIMLIPTVGLSLAALGKAGFDALAKQPRLWQWFAIPVILLVIAYPSWLTYTGFIGVDHRGEPGGWQKMGAELPQGEIVGLTHEYGMRIAYYGWRLVRSWPATADFAMLSQRNQGYSEDFEQMFTEKTTGMDYFLVTLMGEFDAQPQLKAKLYDNYPYTEGEGYIFFDLRHPISP
jgi:4-amino-4-deoxy-L-arabinose transferase-like glycosyltransferase